MSLRNLQRRVEVLLGGRESSEVIVALSVLKETGSAPKGPAGDRARELWQQAVDRGLDDPVVIWLSCHLPATGLTVSDVLQSWTAEDLKGSVREEDR